MDTGRMAQNNQDEFIEMVMQHGAGNWLEEKGNKGWYKCIITGNKFRGDIVKEIREQMEEVKKAIEQADREREAEEHAEEERTEGETQPQQKVAALEKALKENEEKEFEKMSDRLHVHIHHHVQGGIVKGIKLTTIKCMDCNEERVIKVQDVFQVKRCVKCQKKYRNKMRVERRRRQREAAAGNE